MTLDSFADWMSKHANAESAEVCSCLMSPASLRSRRRVRLGHPRFRDPQIHHGQMGTQRGPGRPSKGERELARLRMPVELKARAETAARSQGLTFNDYINGLAAADLGMPYGQQEGLDLGISA